MIRLIVLMLLVIPTYCQQCRTCPVNQDDLSAQFPEAPKSLQHKSGPIFSKLWIGVHGEYLLAGVFDAEATHTGLGGHRCVEGNIDLGRHPSRGELYRNNLAEFGLLTAMDLLFQAAWRKDGSPKMFAWVPLIGAGYSTAVHIKGGMSWFTNGCL